MLNSIKNMFSTPNSKKEEEMAATTTKTTPTPHRETCTVSTAAVGQLSATSECESPSEVCPEAIREKAYLMWEQAGYPEGDGVDFWVAAEKELQLEIYGCHAPGE